MKKSAIYFGTCAKRKLGNNRLSRIEFGSWTVLNCTVYMYTYIASENRHAICKEHRVCVWMYSNSFRTLKNLKPEVRKWIAIFIRSLFLSTDVYGHITLKTPVLVRSPKLSNVEPGQYLDGWPPGNTRCSRHFSYSFY